MPTGEDSVSLDDVSSVLNRHNALTTEETVQVEQVVEQLLYAPIEAYDAAEAVSKDHREDAKRLLNDYATHPRTSDTVRERAEHHRNRLNEVGDRE